MDEDDEVNEIPEDMCCGGVIVCQCNLLTCSCKCCPFCDEYTDTFSEAERDKY